MTVVIGTDEAGYGPNLGPLVVAATAWQLDAPPADVERVLAEAEPTTAPHSRRRERLWMDSKQVYRGGMGFAALERGVLAGVALATGGPPADWPALDAALGGIHGLAERAPEDSRLVALTLPQESSAGDAAERAEEVADHLRRSGAALVAIRCRAVGPAEFNRLLAGGRNKSDILSQVTLRLAAGLLPAGEPAVVWCDRHGGRKHYAPLVASEFAAPLVRVVEETPARSAYELPEADCRIEFSVGGESRTPVALASMTAKYVRELAMRAFNAYWCDRVPGLLPTAGYPVDALRWRREAAAAVARQGLAWDQVWRQA